jgi:glutamate dehydrogenase
MMAMKALDPNLMMDRKLELRIWRESTTIFMTSGHGGCGPYGLALSAYHRGFDLEIHVNEDNVFLVDSVRIELNRRNIAIHSIKSTVMTVKRAGDKLQSLLSDNDTDKDSRKEALIVLEINRQGDGSLGELTEALASVLADVEQVVADYQPMLEQTRLTEQNLELGERSSRVQHVDESREFLRWLMDNNYTFLGYSEYELIREQSGKHLRERVDKRLGIFRNEDEVVASVAVDESNPGMERFHLSTQVLAFSKSSVRSRVHRHAYSDYIVIKRFNEQGDVCGESRLLGLYTSRVYTMSPSLIPLIRRKVAMVYERSDLNPDSHDGKALQQILETFPRDELFQSSGSELYETVSAVLAINERYQVRLFMRPDPFGKFVNAIVYVPREVFTTRMRMQIQDLIAGVIHATEYEFTTYFSESILARVHMVFKVDPEHKPAYDIKHLESRIVAISRSWEDHLQDALLDVHGEEHAGRLIEQYRDAFPSAYRDHFEPRTAVQDIASIAELQSANDISMSFYQPVGADSHVMRFKIFHREETLELSDVIPVLEHLGLRVVSEHPYRIITADQQIIWLHDFRMSYNQPTAIDVHVVKQAFQDAFAAIWQNGSRGMGRILVALILDIVILAYPAYLAYQYRKLPPIHDITTDPIDPPRFEALARLRSGEGANSAVYAGSTRPNSSGSPIPISRPWSSKYRRSERGRYEESASQRSRTVQWRSCVGSSRPVDRPFPSSSTPIASLPN